MVVKNLMREEIDLGNFPSETSVAERFPGLVNARFESADGEERGELITSVNVVVDRWDFLEYVFRVEQRIGRIKALIISQEENFERLRGNLSVKIPGLFIGDMFVGFYPCKEEAYEDFELKSLYALYDDIGLWSERLKDRKGAVVGDKIDAAVAFFANRDEVLRYMKKLSGVIEHNKAYLETREELLLRLKNLAGG